MGQDLVVPVAVKGDRLDAQLPEFLVGNLPPGREASPVQARAYEESAAIGRVSNQVDDGLVGS